MRLRPYSVVNGVETAEFVRWLFELYIQHGYQLYDRFVTITAVGVGGDVNEKNAI